MVHHPLNFLLIELYSILCGEVNSDVSLTMGVDLVGLPFSLSESHVDFLSTHQGPRK